MSPNAELSRFYSGAPAPSAATGWYAQRKDAVDWTCKRSGIAKRGKPERKGASRRTDQIAWSDCAQPQSGLKGEP